MFEICDEPLRQMMGVFNMYGELESPNEGAFLIFMMNRCRQMWGHVEGVFRKYDEAESPNEGACFGFTTRGSMRKK